MEKIEDIEQTREVRVRARVFRIKRLSGEGIVRLKGKVDPSIIEAYYEPLNMRRNVV